MPTIKAMNKEQVIKIEEREVCRGPHGKYAFTYLGNLYLPRECLGKKVTITIKIEADLV